MFRPRRIVVLSVAAAVMAAIALWIVRDYSRRIHRVAGPMVQMVSPSGFTLVWRMQPAKAVRLQVHEHIGGHIVHDAVIEQRNEQYEATISGLRAGQEYDYTIETQPQTWTTKTAPSNAKAFRFLAFGDSGNASRHQYELAQQLSHWRPDMIIHTGDLIYPDGRREDYFRKFFLPYAHLIAVTPFYPCLGNHDVNTQKGAPFLETFVLPDNGPAGQSERCYWFDYGDMRLIAIDSNHNFEFFRDVVAPWLDQVLTQAGPRWKVLFFHEPMYTHGKYENAKKLIDSIGSLIDRHQVELILSGHDHMYERTYPMRGGEAALDGRGTVYVTTAAGGAGLYRQRPQRPSYMAAYDDSQHSFTVVDVTQDWLDVRQIGEDDQPIDETYIARRAGAAASRPIASAREFDLPRWTGFQ